MLKSERHPANIKEAILNAARRQPGLKSLPKSQNFGEDWDLLRFVNLLTSIKQKKDLPFAHFKDIVEELTTWREIRHEYSHQAFTGEGKAHPEETPEDNQKLAQRIATARFLIPKINEIKIGSKEMRKLEGRLWQLKALLELEDELSSEVRSLLN
jgi:hypothetical protein